MRTVQHENGTFSVEVFVIGLASRAHAEATMLAIQNLLCGDEIKTNA
jgi:hypothetical protein